MSHTEYPLCFCGQAPTTDRTRLGQTWNDTLVFTTGTVCACGDRSEKPRWHSNAAIGCLCGSATHCD